MPGSNGENETLTTPQVAELLRVDRATVYRMLWNGALPATKVKNRWRFWRDEIFAWLRAGGLLANTRNSSDEEDS